MNLLILPQYAYPWNHAVVNTVYETLLPSRGHVVHMIRPMTGITDLTRVAAPWGGTVIGYPDEPLGGRIANARRGTRQARWIRRAMREFAGDRLDAILVRNDLVAASAADAEARRRGIPHVYQLSSPDAEFTMSRGATTPGVAGFYMRVRGAFGLAMRRRLSRRASAVLAISDAMRRHLVEHDGLSAARVFSFPMGVLGQALPDAGEVDALRAQLQLPRDRTIVFSGVLDPVRQPGWMLDVFDRVRASLPDAAFLVITYQTDERRRAFEADAARRGANVRVVGPVPFHEVPRYLRCADLAFSPYPPMLEHKVASPTKSIEALAAGVPVVGTEEVDEHAQLLERHGVAVPFDQARCAEAIVTLLQDPARRAAMGAAGREWVLAHRSYAHLTAYLEQILAAAGDVATLRALPHEP